MQLQSKLILKHPRGRVLMNFNDTVGAVHQTVANNSSTIDTNIVFGENLSPDEKSRIASSISEYVDILAPNPKKPTIAKTMEHRIITDETQPVNRKPYRIPHAWHTEIEQQFRKCYVLVLFAILLPHGMLLLFW